MPNTNALLNDFLFITSVPVALLALSWVLGRLFRRSIRIKTFDPPGPSPPPLTPPNKVRPSIIPLVLRRLDASEVDPPMGEGAAALADAEMATRGANRAYTSAGVVYLAVTTILMTLGLPAIVQKWPVIAQTLFIYQRQGPALFLVVWFSGFSLLAKWAIFGSYLFIALLACVIAMVFSGTPIGPNLLHNVSLGDVSYYILVFPMVALLLFLAKPLRPVIMFVFAIALYLLTALVLGFLLKLPDINVHWSEFPWIIPASLMWLFTATIFVGWALGRRRWYSILAYFVLTVPAGLSLNWWLPSSRIGLILLGFPSYALQVLFVWSLFKAFIHLQERISIPAQVLHSYLCWGFLTLLPSIFSSYAQQWWVTWTIALAYGIYVIVLHSNLRRLRAAHADRTGKRLLLLRVFGRADRREDLIDFLEDTWRHIGRIDLIAGTDLALRTLKTRMLEAFLLRRKDEQFLKSAEEVDRRLESLDSHLEGDARYPINSIYCYAAAWQQAVTRLAPQSDAVLMDLRGFTISNQGCVFELRFVIQYILLSRIVLLTDPTSDFQALAQVAELAWAQLPPESPNARLREPVLTILNSPRSRKECRLALFRLLLRASYPFDSRAGHDVGNGYARKREK